MVAWAYDRVPLYREKWDRESVHPRDVRGVADLERLPLTFRTEIQDDGGAAVARGTRASRCARFTTSGSSGEPVTVLFSPRELAVRNGMGKRVLLLYGQPPWARMLRVGNPRPLCPSPYQRLGIYPERRLSAFAPVAEQVRVFGSYGPRILAGYPSSLRLLAEALLQEGQSVSPPRLVLCGGEVLLSSTRSFLAEVFRAPVRDWYGVEELGLIGWECSQGGGHHLCADTALFEVLEGERPVSPGEEGELVVTSLFSRTMPLIRYRLRDRVRMDPRPCPCGIGFPRIHGIAGRSDDLLRLPSGEWVHPVVAACGVVDLPGVRRFRIIQETPGSFRVELVMNGDISGELTARVESHFRTHLGAERVVVAGVKEIRPDPTGKLRHIVFRPRKGEADLHGESSFRG